MRINPTELELRQAVLGGTALLLILAHMVAPGAGVDAVSVVLLVFLALVLYGDEITGWLARMQEPAAPGTKGEASLRDRIHEASFEVEHARVAANTGGIGEGGPVEETLDRILERASGEPRAALLLIWGVLEDRLRALGGGADGLEAAKQLTEQGRVTRQFVDAYASFRSLRNEVARTAREDLTDDLLWSLIDIGGALLALTPMPRTGEKSGRDYQGASQ